MLTSVLVLLAGGACALVPHSPCVHTRPALLLRTAVVLSLDLSSSRYFLIRF